MSDEAAEPAATAHGAPLRWFDHHCHLEPGDAGVATVEAARQAGVVRLVTVGTDVARSHEALAVAAEHPGVVWATAGIHPHEAEHGGLAELEALLAPGPSGGAVAPAVLAVGECGLDYYYDHSPRHRQREVFAAQVELAHRHALPLVIHTRDAWDDTFDVLAAAGVPERTVFHCFTGGPDEAGRCLELGAHLSFSGIVTFKTAAELRAAAALCPLDRLLLETDSPYLAPVPRRGKRNEPAFLPHTARVVAEVKDVPPPRLAEAAWETTNRFYGLPV